MYICVIFNIVQEDIPRIDIDALLEGSESDELSDSEEDADEVESMSSYAFSEDSHDDIEEDAGKEFATLRRASLQSLGEKKIEPEVDNLGAGQSDEIKTVKSKTVTIRSPTT